MKIVIFVELGTVLLLSKNIWQCQIQIFHFSWDLIGGGNVVYNFKFITLEANLLNHLISPTIIKISYWRFRFLHVFSPYPGNQLKVKIIKNITFIFNNLNSTLISCFCPWFDASQVKRRRAESYLRNKSFIELGLL